VKFVVNVPFGLYLFFVFVAFGIAMKLAIIMIALLVLYIMWHKPTETLTAIIFGICVRFWPIVVPALVVVLLIGLAHAMYVKRKAKKETLKIDHQADAGS
jgi:chromate transport protein ChrA